MSDASDSLFPSVTSGSASFSATPGATTNILSSDITPPKLATRMTITVAVSAGSTFGYIATGDGCTATLTLFNGGAALAAGSVYAFTIGCRSSRTYNFQLGSNVTIKDFCVEFTYGYN